MSWKLYRSIERRDEEKLVGRRRVTTPALAVRVPLGTLLSAADILCRLMLFGDSFWTGAAPSLFSSDFGPGVPGVSKQHA
jgi:hypothetical protein